MNEELQNKLYQDFPELFQESKLDMSQTCMCWGIECGDGWEPIIRNVCVLLSSKSRTPVKKRELFPYQEKMQVWLHNFCRKIERAFNLPHSMLYSVSYDRYISCKGWEVRFTQIKEKFGALRIYHDIYPKFSEEEIKDACKKDMQTKYERYCGFVYGVIDFAEHLSEHTCELDGAPGTLNTRGWWSTRCQRCRDKKNENIGNS